MSIKSSQHTIVDIAVNHAGQLANNIVHRYLEDGENLTREISYHQLDQSARAIAAVMQKEHDLVKGDRVVLLFNQGLAFIEALYACFYGGFVAVPVYPPNMGITLASYLRIVANAGTSLILADTAQTTFMQLQSASTPECSQWPILDVSAVNQQRSSDFTPVAIAPEDLALLQYTSGTTGLPKGVMISHANIMANEEKITRQITKKNTIGMSWLPFYHDMGLFGCVIQAMYVGGVSILMSPFYFAMKPVSWLKVLSDYKVQMTGAPNFALDFCVDRVTDEELASLDLRHLSILASGAEPILAKTLERFSEKFSVCGFNASTIVPCYGLAESTLLVCSEKKDPSKAPSILAISKRQFADAQIADPEDDDDIKQLVSNGRVDENNIVIIDPDTGALLPHGQIGEICVNDSSVTSGYWENSTATEAAFNLSINNIPGYYRSGDSGFIVDGELYISGRLKDLIIVNGKNYFSADLEQTIQACDPSLAKGRGAVFSVEINGLERIIVAQEVSKRFEQTIDCAAVMKKIKAEVSQQHEVQLHGIYLLKKGQIKKTSSGKIKRSLCKKEFQRHQLEYIDGWKSRTIQRYLDASQIPITTAITSTEVCSGSGKKNEA